MSVLRFLVRQALKLGKFDDSDRTEAYVDRSGALHVTSAPAVAHDPVDLSSTDKTYAAGAEPRGIWVNGAGDVKVDGFKYDGTAVTGTVFTMESAGALPVGRVSKVWKVGTTATCIALW